MRGDSVPRRWWFLDWLPLRVSCIGDLNRRKASNLLLDTMTVEANGSATSNGSDLVSEIPKTCKAGVVVNEGPDFTVRVEEVPVPEPGEYTNTTGPKTAQERISVVY